MAQRTGEKSYFTFIKGLNTEASPFTFPENASYDEINFELLLNGARRRRLGMDYESGYATVTTTVDESLQAVTVHEWRDAAGDSAYNFVVVQTGRYLRFYPNDTVMSSGVHATVVDLSTYKVSTATQAQQNAEPVSSASGKGLFFVTNKYTDPVYISYTPATDAITVNTFTCRLREFERLDDSLDITETPTTLSNAHRFNLLNQGWNDTNISTFYATYGIYPANSHVMADGYYQNTSGTRSWSVSEILSQAKGSTPAANGSLVTNIFDTTVIYDSNNSIRPTSVSYNGTTTVTIVTPVAHNLTTGNTIRIEGNSFTYTNSVPATVNGSWNGVYTVTVTNSTTFTITVTQPADYQSAYTTTAVGSVVTNTLVNPLGVAIGVRPAAVAFFAGRVWIAGIAYSTLATRVFFSQMLTDNTKIGRFHQEADPTSEEDPDLVDTDGGYLTIPEMGHVAHMEQFGNELLLFTTNGVFAVGGGSENFFKATSFVVRKVVDVTVTSPSSIVSIGDAVVSFTKQGIYQYKEDNVSGLTVGTSLSDTTIQTLFTQIPEACLSRVCAAYDDVFKRIVWTYSLDASNPQRHSRVLIFDVRLGAFYLYSVPATSSIFMSGVVTVRAVTTKDLKLKFFTIDKTNGKITWSDLTNASWKDWYTFDNTGTDAAGYLYTGHELAGDVMRKKQVPYLFLYFKRSETQWVSSGTYSATFDKPSGCQVQTWWDFADSTAGNKVSTAFQGYRFNRLYIPPDALPATFDPGYSIVVTKNKVRGVGKAFQLKFATESGKDCYIYGWATTFTGYTEV